MYSQCPDCQARFRVTAAALRAARGTVRCGRCGSAFDALARLSDTVPPAHDSSLVESRGGEGPPLTVTPDAVIATEYHFSADDLEKVFIDAGDWQKQFGVEATPLDATATEPVGTGAEPPVVEVDENERVEDITLEGERIRIEAPAGFEDEAEVLDSMEELEVLRQVAAPEEVERKPDEPAEESGAAPPTAAPARAARDWPPEPAPRQETLDEVLAPERPGSGVLAWTLGSLVLALALLAQLTHHFRQDLVRHPQLGPSLRTLYERIGLPLSPNWNLSAFELRQWGNDSAPAAGGNMSVRASLTNAADFAQPHPVLRLELEDRFGEAVAVRDFEPAEYLKDPSQAPRLMDPGASVEAELLIADPGREAVGYRLDICVRESATLLRCAEGKG